MFLVASLQERDEQVEEAAQLLAGVVHHGPGTGKRKQSPRLSSRPAGGGLETLDKAESPGFLRSQDSHRDRISQAI